MNEYGADDRLLFSTIDYNNLSKCTVLKTIFPNSCIEINNLICAFVLLINHNEFFQNLIEVINLKVPVVNGYNTKLEQLVLLTEMTMQIIKRNVNISFSEFKTTIDSELNYHVSEIKLRIAYDYAVKHHDDYPLSPLEIDNFIKPFQIKKFT